MSMSEIYQKIRDNPDKTICDQCGHEMQVGDYPFCPHGQGTNARGRDEIPGGVWLENYGPTPVQVFSHSERRAIMKARGLQEMVRHVGVPGTDKSPHTTDFSRGSIDPYTLAAAAALVARVGGQAEKASDPEDDRTIDPAIRQIHTTGDRGDVKVVLEAVAASALYEKDINDAEQMLGTIRKMEEAEEEGENVKSLDA